MNGISRNLIEKLNTLLKYFPAVIILGIRQGGKTTLSKMLRPDWAYFDLEKGSDYDKIAHDPGFFLKQYPQKIIIDEAQTFPPIFQELRHVIDQNKTLKNRFILTGSSSFELLKSVSESLPGRIGIVELGTLKLNEFYEKPISQLYEIFDQKITHHTIDYLRSLQSDISHEMVMNFFYLGGFPEPVLSKNRDFYKLWMENYFKTYLERDIRKLFPRLNILNYRRFLNMLTTLTGTIINRAHVGRSLNTNEVTVKDYLNIAHESFIWRNIPSYGKSEIKTTVKMPKGIFRDSGLLHFLQFIRDKDELFNFPHVGNDFEGFVTEEILKGLEAKTLSHSNYYYYRTRNGAEIDLIIEGDFGVLPIEIKFGGSVKMQQLTSLSKFLKDNELPLGIVINNSEKVELLTENIVQIPAGLV